MHALLEHEKEMFLDLFHSSSGLLVLGKSMGIHRLQLHFMALYSEPHSLVLALNFRPGEARYYVEQLLLANGGAGSVQPPIPQTNHKSDDDVDQSQALPEPNSETLGIVQVPPVLVTSDLSVKEREQLYRRGGVLFITSRILVVDLLLDRVPAALVSGVLVGRAHNVTESGRDAFIVRLLKERQPECWVKAFSENARALIGGFGSVDRTMQLLHVRRLSLWPRFHVQVCESLSKKGRSPSVVECRVSLTNRMQQCQSALMELIRATLKELVRANPALEASLSEEFSLENAITKSFDRLIRVNLHPVWHQLSRSSRALVEDLQALRRLLFLLTDSDAVTFFSQVDALRSEALAKSRNPLSLQARSTLGGQWLYLDAADQLFQASKKRLFPRNAFEVELCPKWRATRDVLRDILKDGKRGTKRSKVLIVLEQRRMMKLLTLYLEGEMTALLAEDESTNEVVLGETLLKENLRQRYEYLTGQSQQQSKAPKRDKTTNPKAVSNKKTKKSKKDQEEEEESDVEEVEVEEEEDPEIDTEFSVSRLQEVAPWLQLQCFDLGEASDRSSEDDPTSALWQTLTQWRPQHVIMFQCNVVVVRQLELHQALCQREVEMTPGAPPSPPVHVFLLVYGDSVEEQRYLTNLRKEKEAFEHLIEVKSSLVLREQHPAKERARLLAEIREMGVVQGASSSSSSTRIGGLPLMKEIHPEEEVVVLVDMREFRSQLPCLLHRKGIRVRPLTLTVGDYILAPHICVERKSVSDLIGSLNSGRLYNQCQAMSRHYTCPALLIEFSMDNVVNSGGGGGLTGGYDGAGSATRSRFGTGTLFSLYEGRQAISKELNAKDTLSKLCLLTLHFPSLRLLWTVSPYASAELFWEIKIARPQPKVELLPKVEQQRQQREPTDEEYDDNDERLNSQAVDMLLKLPGINWKNYRLVLKHVRCLADLSQLPLEKMEEILGSKENAHQLYQFFNKTHENVLSESESGASMAAAGKTHSRKTNFHLLRAKKSK